MSTFVDINTNLELYVDFNTGANRRNISINNCYQVLGKNGCQALPFFHCFTGADSTCSFYNMTKKTWFSQWMGFHMKDELTESFRKLSRCPPEDVVTNSHKIIAKFVMHAYKSRVTDDYDECRFQLFQK